MPLSWRSAAHRESGFSFLEHRGLEAVSLEQLVELGPVALGELRRLRDVPTGDLEQAGEIGPFEGPARLLERHQSCSLFLERVLNKRCRNHRRRRGRE